MSAWWIKFGTARKPACVEAGNEADARALGAELGGASVTEVFHLPYPAEPRLNKVLHPEYGPCPSFCFKPEQCKGHTACPQPYSCTE